MDHYFPEQPVGVVPAQISEQDKFNGLFQQITGNNQNNFNLKAEEVTAQVNRFLELDKTNGFPNEDIRDGLQKVISGNIAVLAIKYRNYYNQWLQDNSEINKTINKFADLDTASNQADHQSETYDQIELETIKEQDVWSDKVKSPSVHSEAFNSYAVEETEIVKDKPTVSWLDQIKARRDNTNVVGSPPNIQGNKPQSYILETNYFTSEPYKVSKIDENQAQQLLEQAKDLRKGAKEVSATISELVDKSNKLDDTELMSAVKETFEGVSNKELPEIQINTSGSSSNNSMDHYFPESKLDKGKNIDISNLSPSEIERRASTSSAIIEETHVENLNQYLVL
jgi:hypothetical protein